MDTLAYNSKKYLTPAWYEKTLVGTYFRDDESAEMLDLIFSTRCYDLGTYYEVGNVGIELVEMINSYAYTFSSLCERITPKCEAQIKDINDKYAAIE